jgi:apolipoprotein N-acyltransferase
MRFLRIVAGILTSGTLFLLALPPVDLGFLGWVAMVPLLWTVHNTRFVYGFLAGLLTCLFSAFLAANGVFQDGSIPDGSPQWIYTGFLLFGWITGVVAGATAELKDLNIRYCVGLAALAVAMELVTMFILPAHIALTQYRVMPALGLASFGGIWIVSFVLWLVNIGFAASCAKDTPKPLIASVSASAVLMVLGFALWKLPPITKGAGGLSVALVQTESTDFNRLSELNLKAGEQTIEVAVWPELSAAGVASAGKTDELVKLARSPGQPSFVTTFKDGNTPLPHNTASIFSAKGESLRYYKRKPFSGERMIHLAGTKPVVVDHTYNRLGLNICFDSCYPAVMRETVQLGADAILLPTQDPRSPYGVIQAIHAAYTPFRAAELGVPIARTDMSAHSMLVGPMGEIVAQAGSGTEEVLYAHTPLRPHNTLYKLWGDWFLYVCAALMVWSAWGLRNQRRLTRYGGQVPADAKEGQPEAVE